MAFGTPVTGTVAYAGNNAASISPAYPAGILATDAVLLVCGQKPNVGGAGLRDAPAGWTVRAEMNPGYGFTGSGGYNFVTPAADTGDTGISIFSWDSPVAGQTGTRSVTLSQNNVAWAFIIRVPSSGGALSYWGANSSKTTGGNVSQIFDTSSSFETNDFLLWAMCIPTDVTTPAQFSAHTITASGATFAAVTEINEPDSTTGNDIGGYSARTTVTSGSSLNQDVTVTAAAAGTTTNVRGPLAIVRIREAVAAATSLKDVIGAGIIPWARA